MRDLISSPNASAGYFFLFAQLKSILRDVIHTHSKKSHTISLMILKYRTDHSNCLKLKPCSKAKLAYRDSIFYLFWYKMYHGIAL